MTYEKIRQVIREISGVLEIGDTVEWECNPKELRWIWTNTKTQQKWVIRLSETKSLWTLDGALCFLEIMAFIKNEKNAQQVNQILERREKLKAFW
jgi:hypothetical protein